MSISALYSSNHIFRQPLHRQLLHIRHTHSADLVKEIISMLREHNLETASIVTVNDFMLVVTKGHICTSYVIKSLNS